MPRAKAGRAKTRNENNGTEGNEENEVELRMCPSKFEPPGSRRRESAVPARPNHLLASNRFAATSGIRRLTSAATGRRALTVASIEMRSELRKHVRKSLIFMKFSDISRV